MIYLLDFSSTLEERIKASNELQDALKEVLSSGDEKEYQRKTKNSTEMFKSLSEELKEIKDKILTCGDRDAADIISQIQPFSIK